MLKNYIAIKVRKLMWMIFVYISAFYILKNQLAKIYI